MTIWRALCVLTMLAWGRVAAGQEIRNITAGWGNSIRLGRWTPIFVTVEDPQAREIDLQIHGAYGEKSEALWLHQTAVAQPQPTTYSLLYPVNTQPSKIVVIVSDRQTGRTLDWRVMQSDASFSPGTALPRRLLSPNETLVGISGDIQASLAVAAQLKTAGIGAGVLDPLHLPANFAGYDGISLLFLAAPDLDQLKFDQEQAILQWVERGGNLLLIPPATPVPDRDPIVAELPCEIGINQALTTIANQPATRPTALNARALTPRAGAMDFPILGQTGYWRNFGLGKIAVAPVNVSPLEIADARAANDFWRSNFDPLVKIPQMLQTTSMVVSDVDAGLVAGPNRAQSVGRGQRESDSIFHLMQMMGAADSAPEIHWRAGLLWLMGLCFLLGPVDSILLMRLGQRPRSWVTLLGWAGLILSVSGLVGAGELKPRAAVVTFRLVDQVDDKVVAATDLVSFSANHPMVITPALDKNEWWEPANQAARIFSPDRFVDADCRQDKNGTRPQEVKLNGIEPQAWHGEASDPGARMIRAELHVAHAAGNQVVLNGSITNASSVEMTDIHVLTSAGNFLVEKELGPGQTIALNQPLAAPLLQLAGLPADVTEVSPERADRCEEMVKGGFIEVICRMTGADDLKTGVPTKSHWEVLRGIFPG